MIGPPRVAPPILRLLSGLAPELAQLRARRLSSSCSQKPEPWSSLVPLLVRTVTAAPPAIPCSASKLAVETLTVSTVSAGAMYTAWCGRKTYTLVAPSRRVLLLLLAVPLTFVLSARAGLSVTALWYRAGVAPGKRLRRAW